MNPAGSHPVKKEKDMQNKAILFGRQAADAEKPENTKFSFRDKIGYMFGDVGNDFYFVSVGTYLTVFYTDVLGISGYVIGLLFLLARFWDGITDIMMGRIIDTAKRSKDGKFRPWIRRMAIPLAVSGVILFIPVTGLSMQMRILYACITYILYGMAYTGVNIPYGSMASVMSDDPAERASLSTFRNVGSSLSSALVNFIIPIFCFVTLETSKGEVQKPDGGRFFVIMVIFAVLALISHWLCYRLCTERLVVENADESGSADGGIRSVLRGITKNRPLLVLLLVSIILLLSQQISGTMNTYVYTQYFKQSGLLSIAGILMTICTLSLAPFISKIVGRFGKKASVVFASLSTAFFYTVLGMIHTENVYVYLFVSLLATFGAAFFNTIVWALVLDVIDYQEMTTGFRSDATIYATYSFSRKIGQALAGGLSGLSLTMVGYISAKGSEAIVQSEQTIQNIYNVATFVPALTYLIIGLIVLFFYPLTKKKLAEMNAALRKEKVNVVSENQ